MNRVFSRLSARLPAWVSVVLITLTIVVALLYSQSGITYHGVSPDLILKHANNPTDTNLVPLSLCLCTCAGPSNEQSCQYLHHLLRKPIQQHTHQYHHRFCVVCLQHDLVQDAGIVRCFHHSFTGQDDDNHWIPQWNFFVRLRNPEHCVSKDQ